jgi:hypothetical protein
MSEKNKSKLWHSDGMRPMMILPPHALSQADIKKLNDNGICTVVAKNPGALKFVDPIPSVLQRSKMEDAAIKLSRKILNRGHGPFDNYGNASRKDLIQTYVELLVDGTSLDPAGTIEERQQAIFEEEKEDELRRLAREEAKAVREAKKKAQEEKQKSKTL